MADDHPTKPSRESMREVKKEFKARRKAEQERAEAARAYWDAETGRSSGTGRSRGRSGAVAGLVAVVALSTLGATALLHVGPFAPASSAASASPQASPTASASAAASAPESPPASPPSLSADPQGTADPGTGLAGALYGPGSCPSEYLVNPAGGRRVVTGSCEQPHAAEVVEVVAGGRIWSSYPTKAQRAQFNQLCYLAAMDYLGFRGTAKQLQAYADRVLHDRGIGGLAAFPAATTWAVDKGVICALTTTGSPLPAGSLKGTIPS